MYNQHQSLFRNICIDIIGGDNINNEKKAQKALIPLIAQDEEFRYVTGDAVPGVCEGMYMVSNYGRVYSNFKDDFLNQSNSWGYRSVPIRRSSDHLKNERVHRLELEVFEPIANSNSLDVNHIDGNKANNRLDNLEWCTRSQNIQHAYDTGLHPKEGTSALARISEDTAKQIADLLATNQYTNQEIADMVGNNATISVVADIKKRNAWKSITEGYDFYQKPWRLFTDDDIRILCKYFEDHPKPDDVTINDQCRAALRDCGFDDSNRYVETMRKVYVRKYHTNISKDYKF